MNHRHPTARRRNSGFTLIELMVAMTVGLMVIGGAYYITQTTGRVFAEQARRAETQLTLRGAVDLMRRDIARAGFASVRSTNEMTGCNNNAAGGAGVISGDPNAISPVALAAAWWDTDAAGRRRLYLTGNFSTTDQYPVDGFRSSGSVLTFNNTTSYAFMRSFLMPVPGGPAAANSFLASRFSDAFMADVAGNIGRMVHVMDLARRKSFLRDVLSVTADPNAPSIQLAVSLPTKASGCDFGPQNLMVAPVSAIRYAVVNTAARDPEVLAAVGASGTYMTGGDRLVLVRSEIQMTTLGSTIPAPAGPLQVVPGTTRAIVDFLEPTNGFMVEGVYDATPPNTLAAPNLQRVDGPTSLVTFTSILPEQLRSLVVTITAHGAEQQNVGADQARARAGRRTARFEVFMPNMARNPGARL